MGPETVELLFLHPLPFDGSVWNGFRQRFDGFATHAPTMYSLGDSLEEVARSVLDGVDGDRLVVVGNSIGGSCALEVAAASPERVEHLVLIGTKAGHRPEPARRDRALALLDNGGVGRLWDDAWAPLFSTTTAPSAIEAARRQAVAVPVAAVAAGVSLFHSRRDLTHVIDRWSRGLTVVTGRHDRAPRPVVGEGMVRRSEHGRLHIIENCGHYVHLERPAPLAAIVGDVLSRM